MMKTTKTPPKDLLAAAKQVRLKAHAPYSGKRVGAAVLTTDGDVYVGCNVENAAFPAGACAEQVAIQSAVAAVGKIQIQTVVVVTDAKNPWPPCGVCRQVIYEFSPSSPACVYWVNSKGHGYVTTIDVLLPRAFGPKDF